MLRMVKRVAMEGPVLVFGGAYSNLEATEALLAAAAGHGIPPHRIVCTGDVVAYGADAAATAERVRRAGIHVVMGNCEESLAASAADCGCGFTPGSTCATLSAAWYAHAAAEIGAELRLWMAALPRRLEITLAGRRLAVVHGAASSINRFLFASSPAAEKRAELDLAGTDGVIAGHCGVPFTQILDARVWHNAGAIGMPANDGTPRAWYSLLVPTEDGIRFEHHALEYDHAAAAAKMRRAGLPESYATALGNGLWPSCDVLPATELASTGVPLEAGAVLWRTKRGRRSAPAARAGSARWPPEPPRRRLDAAKFRDPERTLAGDARAVVALGRLQTLWFNTGTLCNIACRNCYIESSPRNDRLVYLTLADVRFYLDEIERDRLGTEEIGFTGGEPFMNPEFLPMVEETLARGYRALVLTNAMRPMQRLAAPLLALQRRLGEKLTMRVSLDHWETAKHEELRGEGTFRPTVDGLLWLARHGFRVAVAGRTAWGESEAAQREGYAAFFRAQGIPIDAQDRSRLVLFPEMDAEADVPEISERCWSILGVDPAAVMCASSRMVVRRKGAAAPAVIACTLLPYDERFELGATLAAAASPVPLNHPHCAKFCVLGGASCSASV